MVFVISKGKEGWKKVAVLGLGLGVGSVMGGSNGEGEDWGEDAAVCGGMVFRTEIV